MYSLTHSHFGDHPTNLICAPIAHRWSLIFEILLTNARCTNGPSASVKNIPHLNLYAFSTNNLHDKSVLRYERTTVCRNLIWREFRYFWVVQRLQLILIRPLELELCIREGRRRSSLRSYLSSCSGLTIAFVGTTTVKLQRSLGYLDR